MAQDIQTVRDDLAFVRTLAQEGRRAPLLSGRFLLAGGLVYAAASLVDWAMEVRIVDVADGWRSLVWVVATAVYLPVMRLAIGSVRGKPGLTAASNRAVAAVWQGLGWALLSVFCAMAIIANMLRAPAVFSVSPSLVLAIYGMAWWLAATMSDLKWIRRVSVGCFTAAVLIGFLVTSANIYLAYAAALLLLIALPGWLLVRGEPSNMV